MSDPVRLSSPRSKAPATLRQLLRAGRAEVPDNRRLDDIAQRLGFAAIAPAPTHALAAKSAGASFGISNGAKVGAVLLLAVGAGVGVAATHSVRPPAVAASRPQIVPTAASAEATPARQEDREPPPSTETKPATSATGPTPRSRPPATRGAPASANAPVATPSTVSGVRSTWGSAIPAASALAEEPSTETEPELLQRAQHALPSDAARALDLANRQERQYPSGKLAEERELVAIEALVKLRRHDEARSRAGQFLQSFPGSVHQRHVEWLLGFDTGVDNP
ncbi:MAG TPA: hypothetical protein VGL81_13255 [Polyangiaceae bacterium]|jgi:hypothetical protein